MWHRLTTYLASACVLTPNASSVPGMRQITWLRPFGTIEKLQPRNNRSDINSPKPLPHSNRPPPTPKSVPKPQPCNNYPSKPLHHNNQHQLTPNHSQCHSCNSTRLYVRNTIDSKSLDKYSSVLICMTEQKSRHVSSSFAQVLRATQISSSFACACMMQARYTV